MTTTILEFERIINNHGLVARWGLTLVTRWGLFLGGGRTDDTMMRIDILMTSMMTPNDTHIRTDATSFAFIFSEQKQNNIEGSFFFVRLCSRVSRRLTQNHREKIDLFHRSSLLRLRALSSLHSPHHRSLTFSLFFCRGGVPSS
jgi:hypothetical protein